MLIFYKNLERLLIRNTAEKKIVLFYSSAPSTKREEFRVLNLKHVKGQFPQRRQPMKIDVLPPRSNQMPVNQDWGNVWPGPKTFHPAVVPLPVRQGYAEKGAPPDKYGNAELMKIPNFLHLTPPVIKRQCESLKKFCTPWPKGLEKQEDCAKHLPFEVSYSDYCHSSPTIRDPLSRIVTVKFNLSVLQLNNRAKDKFLRLVGERHNVENDTVTIVTDRCPLRTQNYDYAMYLITALYHESCNIEQWESEKSEADMEYYEWKNNTSKTNIEAIFSKPSGKIPNINHYSDAVSNLMNEGESEYTVNRYGEAVRGIFGLQCK